MTFAEPLCCVFVLIFGPCSVILPYILSWDQKVPGMPINHIIFLIEWGCINVVVVHCLDSTNKICISTTSHILNSQLIVLMSLAESQIKCKSETLT